MTFTNADGKRLVIQTSRAEWDEVEETAGAMRGEVEVQYSGGLFRGRLVSVEPYEPRTFGDA